MTSDEVEVHALPYVLVLHAFCLVDPTLCAPASNPSQFVVTLQPYLKTQVISIILCFTYWLYSSITMNCTYGFNISLVLLNLLLCIYWIAI